MTRPQEPGPRQPESARDRLLAAAVAMAMQGGIADLSLREMAAAVGTSHRMLLYHFGSREGLLAAVTMAVEDTERTTLRNAGAISAEDSRQLWARYCDPGLWPQERLFFELYAHALRGRPGTEGFLEHVVTGWLEPLAAAIADRGLDPQTARAAARLSMAVTRGLLLDLLATHDTDGVTEAFELFLQLGELAAQPDGPEQHAAPRQLPAPERPAMRRPTVICFMPIDTADRRFHAREQQVGARPASGLG